MWRYQESIFLKEQISLLVFIISQDSIITDRISGFGSEESGGAAALSSPLSTFKRVETSINIRSSEKEWIFSQRRRPAFLLSNFTSFVQDNSIWGPTGPIDGQRLNLTLGYTQDVAHSNVHFWTAIFDYRRYFRIGHSVAHAVRVWALINHGKEATPYYMGGSWDLRGYRLGSIWGSKIALISNELRFPFIDRFMLHFPFGGLAINSIRGAMFLDVGNAWDADLTEYVCFGGSQDDNLTYLLGSTGFGIRFNFGGFLVLRLDVGRKFLIPNYKQFYDLGSYEVDNKWFTQFFFGWDF